MRFHIDSDNGREISLWVAPDHPEHIPRVSVWAGEKFVRSMDANVLREDVRQLGMHSTGHVGFSLTADEFPDLSSVDDLSIIYDGVDEEVGGRILLYRRAPSGYRRGARILIFDSGSGIDCCWHKALEQYAMRYEDVGRFSYETLLSILGNEVAPSIAAVGFPYLVRIRHVLAANEFDTAMYFRSPSFELARQIAQLPMVKSLELHADAPRHESRNVRRTLTTAIRGLSETERFEITNPVVRRLVKSPGEAATTRDLPNALKELSEFRAVVTDTISEQVLLQSGDSDVPFLPVREPNQRDTIIASYLSSMAIALDLIAEDLQLYEIVCGAVDRAVAKELEVRSEVGT